MTDAYQENRLQAEMLEACYPVVAVVNYAQRRATGDTAVGCVVKTRDGAERLVAVPQLKVTLRNETKHYYLDFAVLKTRVLLRRALCVEVDGTQYHTTPEAQAYDKQRDQDLRSEGWEVLRFTGAEVFRDARSCAERVVAEMGK